MLSELFFFVMYATALRCVNWYIQVRKFQMPLLDLVTSVHVADFQILLSFNRHFPTVSYGCIFSSLFCETFLAFSFTAFLSARFSLSAFSLKCLSSLHLGPHF